jgi:Ras-related protein Rab-8A
MKLVKLLIIGDSNVGKSCFLLRFCDDSFTPSFISTVGIDFKIRTIDLDGKQYKLQIWDTAGQERFRVITTAYYRGAHGIVFAFDITNKESFDNMDRWIHDVMKQAPLNVARIMVGCKCDLEHSRTIGKKNAQNFANQYNMQYEEVSAKENVNVDTVFYALTRMVLEREEKDTIKTQVVPLNESITRDESKRCC